MSADKKPVVVVGGGLAGSLAALYLAKRGYQVDVYERRSDSRKEGNWGGRSINLAISDRGLTALAGVGLREAIESVGIKMSGRLIHSMKGDLIYQPYGNPGQYILSVSRRGLNEALVTEAEKESNINFFFNHPLASLDLESAHCEFKDESNNNTKKSVDAHVVIGGDGAYSAVRQQMQKKDRFAYEQYFIPHGYKELHIPAIESVDENGNKTTSYAMREDCLHIWPRHEFMMIALPNPDKSFTLTLFMPFDEKKNPDSPCFAELKTRDDITAFMNKYFADAVPMMPALIQDWEQNPTSSMVTVRCSPYHYKESTLLIGDAAHAIVPFYGQGCNCAFEDCRVLDELLASNNNDLKKVLPLFTKERKPNADAIADLALYNLKEMSDKTASTWFLRRKQLERFIYRMLPKNTDIFIPLYTMVTFSPHIPYSTAISRNAKQEKVLDYILGGMVAAGTAATVYAGYKYASSSSSAASSSSVVDAISSLTSSVTSWFKKSDKN